MIDYNLGYKKLCQNSTEAQLFFINKQIKSYALFEKLLGFSFELNQSLAPVYAKISSNIEEPRHLNVTNKQMMEISVANLCVLNIHSIWHALRPLEENSINNCANMIRPVYESIPKMFYMLCHPEDVDIILMKESFGLWISQKKYRDKANKKEILEDYEYWKYYLTKHDPEETENDNRVRLKRRERSNIKPSKRFYKDRFYGKYSNQWYRDKIYTEKSLAMQNAVYASLSLSSHANITRYNVEIQYDPVMSLHFFKILTDLAFFNLYVCFNATHSAINQITELENTKKFITDAQQELESHYEMTNLYPDVPEYIESLILHP